MRIILLISIFITVTSCSVIKHNRFIEEPKYNKDDSLYFKHYAYSFLYNEEIEQSDWVSYQLLVSELEANYKRTNNFYEDTLVITGTATNADYKYSGYDKGHLAPAADMTWNKQAMKESFYFSNISPQLPEFNRGIWKKLETKVRKWAEKYYCLYITTGPIFENTDKTIGINEVVIPTHFFKTILIYNDSIMQGIGFLFPHEKCNEEIIDYAVSIDRLEIITGNDFYHLLPNRHEKDIEMQFDLKFWEEK